jgi:hypothetical protein
MASEARARGRNWRFAPSATFVLGTLAFLSLALLALLALLS